MSTADLVIQVWTGGLLIRQTARKKLDKIAFVLYVTHFLLLKQGFGAIWDALWHKRDLAQECV